MSWQFIEHGVWENKKADKKLVVWLGGDGGIYECKAVVELARHDGSKGRILKVCETEKEAIRFALQWIT